MLSMFTTNHRFMGRRWVIRIGDHNPLHSHVCPHNDDALKRHNGVFHKSFKKTVCLLKTIIHYHLNRFYSFESTT